MYITCILTDNLEILDNNIEYKNSNIQEKAFIDSDSQMNNTYTIHTNKYIDKY